MPVRPLRGSNFTSQGSGADFARGVLEGGAQVAPEAVNDLCAGFHGHTLATGKLVFPNLCVVGFHPHLLALDQHLSLLVRHIVVQDTWQLHLVGLDAVRMQDDILTSQGLVSHGWPVKHLGEEARRCTRKKKPREA